MDERCLWCLMNGGVGGGPGARWNNVKCEGHEQVWRRVSLNVTVVCQLVCNHPFDLTPNSRIAGKLLNRKG